MKQKKHHWECVSKHSKKIWCLNILMLIAVILIQTPGSFWLMSISQGTQAKAFQGAMMPLAFRA